MCRDVFRQSKILRKIIPTIEEVLAAGELELPKPTEENIAPAIPNPESIGDVGHRS
jgi:CRISPR-associated protein Cas1